MSKRRLFAAALVLFVSAGVAFGAELVERHNVPYEDIAAGVLRDVMGVFSVATMGVEAGGLPRLGFQEYVRSDGEFEMGAWVAIQDTMPLSNFGSAHPSDPVSASAGRGETGSRGVSASRYPIVGIDGDYVEIVSDPRIGRRMWVRRNELIGDHETRVDMFEDLPEICSADPSMFVDVACFTTSGRRRVYEGPRRDAASRVVNFRPYGPGTTVEPMKVLRGEGEFVLLARYRPVGAGDLGKPEIVGWVRLRANTGELLLWLRQEEVR